MDDETTKEIRRLREQLAEAEERAASGSVLRNAALQARLDASPHAEGCGVNGGRCAAIVGFDGNHAVACDHTLAEHHQFIPENAHDFQPGECTPNCHRHPDWQPDAAGGGA